MFKYFSSLFCDRQYMYKTLIYSTYSDYVSVYTNITQKYPKIKGGLMTIDEHNLLNNEEKTEYRNASIAQKKIRDELISLVKTYCKKYQNEEICKYHHLQTYNEYPYRLHQTLPDFIKLL